MPGEEYIAATMRSLVPGLDRKSTRLNSSHSQISYAVFCLKKKNVNGEGHTEFLTYRDTATYADTNLPVAHLDTVALLCRCILTPLLPILLGFDLFSLCTAG